MSGFLKLWYIYTIESCLANKKEQATGTCSNTDEPQKHYSTPKKPVTKNHLLCDSISVTLQKAELVAESKSVVTWAGNGEGTDGHEAWGSF